ncbi:MULTISPECIES: phosphate ABC transporter permease PstA [Flavobacteriaceae]|uniref:Phosphate transport system permease protein PstA n=2 Tax=Flavobacteriaceae TaxID=49546 RepID=A0A4Y8AR66_9FLAO|nr:MULTISPECIES: phosphate ABC transporter permease PstA [Flavobacteriaceae]TEW73695.1 phosphate ABC transporter permease PstA [Gramella jeungdoensis]GGK36771.1 phosphate transport system permease protein PstA [Lutibacter litoralis]
MNNFQKNKLIDHSFKILGMLFTFLGILILAILIYNIVKVGYTRINWTFLTSLPSRKPENAGIYTAIIGTLDLMLLTVLFAIPVGVGAGIYLEEYAKKSKLSSLLEINISNLAGVPSIIYGLLGLGVFVRFFNFGGSILSGSLTLSLLILPIIIVATREAIKAVPHSLKEASFALGASKWQTIKNVVLPSSFGGILTGIILSLSRAIGETAPLIVVGAMAYVPFVPQSIFDTFSVLPMQIFNWTTRPQQGFAIAAAGAIIVLLLITFVMNGIAVYFRNRWQKKLQ